MLKFNYLKSNLLLLALLLSLNVLGQEKETLRVLFVGNSYTYFWNLPQMVSALAADQGMSIITRKSTLGGATLKQHWEGERGLETKKMISEGEWDVVVLQNHSKSTINDPVEFEDYGKKFIELVKAKGAKPLLYMTWARNWNPLMQETISEGYRDLAKSTGVDLAPVGEVWGQARILRPDLSLFDPDGSHPSQIGTYLTACVFYRILSGKASQGLSGRLSWVDQDGEEIFLAIIPEGEAEFIHQLVDKVLVKTMEQE
ncbi:hypothetical protein [Echinicola vietnamensis]|uniref:SGNH/GDSL hydrolase family protein n=1 Tax=Echinicola vietnamensis (strain DSM 17526 / LMG 23754 / KMM 6221) TaxID=926556 RepID=L0G6B6_ECHVK|nr:hypothetical protein [Echinicola vietnamensis]AGA80395.1 hypothetical protein Echvi_4198 [Echinicola vietnamensis DSM 17526]